MDSRSNMVYVLTAVGNVRLSTCTQNQTQLLQDSTLSFISLGNTKVKAVRRTMLSRWIQRAGIGQILAPDPNFQEEERRAENNEFAGGVWSVVAPDPNFMSPVKQMSETQRHHSYDNKDEKDGTMVECIHCHLMTPVSNSRKVGSENNVNFSSPIPSGNTPTPSSIQTPFSSPLFSPNGKNIDPELLLHVLSASQGTAESMSSPEAVWSSVKLFCTMCASSKDLGEKKLKKLRKMLKKDPSLATARASNMFELADNGYTALMCAANAGNLGVVELLVNFTTSDEDSSGSPIYPVDLNATDFQGATALHIASKKGHVEVAKFLRETMTIRNGIDPIGPNAPIDVAGKTPYGYAVTSRETKARQNKTELSETLFSPGDKSVYGVPTPAQTRTGGKTLTDGMQLAPMDLSYGFAEKEGHRIIQEDAMCHRYPIEHPTFKNGHIGFFGVFDGHGDGGVSSQFVAQHIIDLFLHTSDYQSYNGENENLSNALKSACHSVDTGLKSKIEGGNIVLNGGSTGIMAIITPTSIIVGNVGDSRCILVQKEDKISDESKVDKGIDGVVDAVKGISFTETTTVSIKPLSVDHKPSIPSEKERIEKAGLSVIEETFPGPDALPITISKVKKSENNMIAMSRAFGDFDYKNNELAPEERAIICTPEINIHHRSNEDRFLILACDGVFDVMTNDEVGSFVVQKVEALTKSETESTSLLAEVCDALLEECLEKKAHDNMSVMIIHLPQSRTDSPTRAINFADI